MRFRYGQKRPMFYKRWYEAVFRCKKDVISVRSETTRISEILIWCAF